MKFNSIINDICCDNRIKDGILRLDNTDHVFILQEYLEKNGYSIDEIVKKTAKLFEAGRFPERQAYNKDGILVTFPNKEYRDKAVDKGTHFAENPKKSSGTLFSQQDVGGLSTADVKTKEEPSDSKEDSVSLDKEINKKITGDETVDDRTNVEKSQDSEVVQSILTGESPLVNYSVDEAIKYGFYNKGHKWYNSDGDYVGEQVYDEIDGLTKIISEDSKTDVILRRKDTKSSQQKKECNSKKMEFWVDDELNGIETNNSIAKKLADDLKLIGVIGSESTGKTKCPVSNPLFAQIKPVSKTDLVLKFEVGEKKVSMKNESSQLCSAENKEINAILGVILEKNNEDKRVMSAVSSFILDGLKKEYYNSLTDELKEQLNLTLSSVISSKKKLSKEDFDQKAIVIKSILQKNKEYLKNGDFSIDTSKILMILNEVITKLENKKELIYELATGRNRWSGDVVCLADHMMCWDCYGQHILYTIDEFVNDNLNKMSFRFRERGGIRGISLRSDNPQSPKEESFKQELNEELQKVDVLLEVSFDEIWNTIKNVSGEIKNYLMSLYEYVKLGLKEIYSIILNIGNYLLNLIRTGWENFINTIGFEPNVEEGSRWEFRTPQSVGDDIVDENISLVTINHSDKLIEIHDYDQMEEVVIDEAFIEDCNLSEKVMDNEPDLKTVNPEIKPKDDIKPKNDIKVKPKDDIKVKDNNEELDILRNLGLSRFKDEEIRDNLNQNISLETLSPGPNNKYGLTNPINYKGLESILNKEGNLIITYAGKTKKIRTTTNIRIAEWQAATSIKSNDFRKALMVYQFYKNNKDRIKILAKPARGLGYEKKQVQHLNDWFKTYTIDPLRLYISDETGKFRDTDADVNKADKLPGSGKADLVLKKNNESKFWISYKHGHYWSETGTELSPVPFQQYGSIKTLNKKLSGDSEKDKWNKILTEFLLRMIGTLPDPKILNPGEKLLVQEKQKIITNVSLSKEQKDLILTNSSAINKIFTRQSNESLIKKIYFLPSAYNAWMDLLDGSNESRQIAGMSIYGLDFKLNSTNYGPENVNCLIQTNELLDVKLKTDEDEQPIGIEISTDKRGHILFNPNMPAPEGAENPILQYRPVINARYTQQLSFVYQLGSELIVLLGCRILVMPYGILPGTSISL